MRSRLVHYGLVVVSLFMVFLASCGGGGGGSSSSGGSVANTTVTGQLQASYINGVKICVNDNSIGTVSENCDITKNQGNFSLANAVGKNLAVLIDTVLIGTMPADKVSETTIITPAAMSGGAVEKAQRITDIFHQASSTTDNQTYDMSSIKGTDIDNATLSAFLAGTINTINIGPLTVVHGSVSSYTVSGKVTDTSGNVLSGVTISITGTTATFTTTGNDGTYSSTALQNGSYTVTPSLTGYTFSPASKSITVSGTNLTGQDFTATVIPPVPSTYTISGKVTLNSVGLSGVTVSLAGASTTPTTTDANGNYAFTGALNGSYTVTSSLTGYTFSPASKSITVSGANLTGQDFTAAPVTYTISGKTTLNGAGLSGVTVSLTGATTTSATTDSNGNYAFAGALNGSYTITPSLTGYTFSPSSKSATVSGANLTGQDFTAAAQPPIVQSSSIAVNVLGVAASTVTGSVNARDPNGFPLTYSIKTTPQLGTASITSDTGAFTYSIVGHTQAASDSFTVTVSNGLAQSIAQVNVQLAADPLLQNQWHIQNVGQDAFSSTLPVAGNDMNVIGAWTAGYSGKGIKVGVVDSGLEAAHEDLAANVDVVNSFNFLTGLHDPSRATTGDIGYDHGTQVAGIIGAVAFNGKGGRGVAYNARLRGYNLFAVPFLVANMAKSFGSDPISADNDVFNASFHISPPNSLPTFSDAYQAITANTLTLRGGLGAAIVNAAGNEFKDWSSKGTGLCTYANQYGVSCGDPATDVRRGGYVPIIVGAIDADGKHSSYSSTGSSLWISAPGGESGLNSTYYATGSNFAPAIVTTSRTGCANSLYSSAVNPLDDQGVNPFAPNCQYTATMNGTSSATPNVTGVIAMMLEANSNLSVRDLKYILAKTAKKVDPTFSDVSSADIIPGSTVFLEQGWVTNSAGWSFSNRYGFGAVDASAAVAMAKSYTSYLPAVQNGSFHPFLVAAPATITPLSPTGNSAVFTVTESFNTVEFVVVFLNIASTPGLYCNQVELTSPSGTKSILMHAANGFSNASVVNSRILSNAFYGEPVNGNWTLTFFDFCTASATQTKLSTIVPQSLGFVGH